MQRIYASQEPYWRLRKRQRLRVNKSIIRHVLRLAELSAKGVDDLWSAIFYSKIVRQVEPGRFEVDNRLEDYKQKFKQGAF